MQVCSELVQRLIPGMSLMSPNPFFAAELWSLLELLPYRRRYELYEDTSVSLQASTACYALKQDIGWQHIRCSKFALEAKEPMQSCIGSMHVRACQALAFITETVAWPPCLLCNTSNSLPGSLTLQLQT